MSYQVKLNLDTEDAMSGVDAFAPVQEQAPQAPHWLILHPTGIEAIRARLRKMLTKTQAMELKKKDISPEMMVKMHEAIEAMGLTDLAKPTETMAEIKMDYWLLKLMIKETFSFRRYATEKSSLTADQAT